MSIQTDFNSYKTVDGYLCPNPIPPGTIRGCDNQPLYTSEYILILLKNNVITQDDITKYTSLINACVNNEGYLTRAPGDTTLGNPDNSVGVYAAYAQLNLKVPFKFYWELIRQPQLLYAHLCCKLTFTEQLLLYPFLFILELCAAISILISCYTFIISWSGISILKTITNSTDPRLLSWCLIQATKKRSLLCYLASLIWYKRLKNDYGSDEMKAVAAQYFYPQGLNNNPYSLYWIS